MTEVDKKLDTLAEKINREHRRVESAVGSALEHAQRAGRLLIEAKERVKHGEWLPWLAENFEGSERAAQMYMRVHSQWPQIEANTKSVSDLTLSGALKSIGAPTGGLSRIRAEGELRWAGGGEDPETTATVEMPATEREPGVIERLQETPQGREALAEANSEFVADGAYLRMRSKIHDLSLLIRHVPPEEAARREFAHHAADAARDAVLDRRRRHRIAQAEDAEAVRDWLSEYIQRLKDADAHLREHTEGE